MLKKVLLSIAAMVMTVAAARGDADKILHVEKPAYFVAGQSYKITVTYNASAESQLLVQIKTPAHDYKNKNIYKIEAGSNRTFTVPLEIEDTVPAGRRYLFTIILADANEKRIYTRYLDRIAFAGTRIMDAETLRMRDELFKTRPGKPVGPTDPAVSPNAKKVYEFLQSLGPKKTKKLLSGQYFRANYKVYYDNVVKLHEKSGKWVGMLHSTYENSTVRRFYHCSSEFIYPLFYNAWHRGAVLMILINPPNPWHGQGRGYRIEGQETMIPEGHSVEELFDPKTKAAKTYREILACHADNLEYFRKDDIPIIIRLFGENNGNWFWFQHGSPEVGPENFQKLWKLTVDFFRNERGMHNLLFCYEVTDRREGQLNGLVPEMTDILGIQVGADILDGPIGLYYRFLPYGKPIVLPQLLIGGEASMNNKQYDTLKLMEAYKKWNPYVVAYTPWNDFIKKGKLFSIGANINCEKAMADPYHLHMDETPFVQTDPPAPLPVPKSEEEGTITVSGNVYTWNFDHPSASKWAKPWKGSEDGFTVNKKDRKSILYATEMKNRLHIIYHGPGFGLITGKSFSIDADAYKYLNIRMRNYSQAKQLAVRWDKNKVTEINSKNVVRAPINKFETPYSEYKIDLSKNGAWNGRVKTVELLFGTDTLTGSAEIDCIYFSRD